ncbi:unnamed protein product [Diabrotica balteata]|uniref:Fibronectin type-III domain-containing protein n=1 Tax=Diabrotica balteata TaxID=107213 RepID=A0A9N9T819_DIABA|nr:unnamed protein product [Diabrotica balteata]
MYGRDQQLVQLLVQEPPVPPQNVEAAMISSRSVNLKWQHKSGDTHEVFKFIIEYREMDRSWHQIELSDSPLPFTALIEDLKPATKYTFHVIAEGPAGKSSPSEDLLLRTEPQRPAGPPLNPATRPISSSEILVTWSPPLPELRHGDIQGFNIGYRTATMGSYNFTSVNGDGEDGGEILLGGLNKYTRYTIVVQAFNEVGAGPLSEPVTAQTMEDVPGPPADLKVVVSSPQSLKVSWLKPVEPNGVLTKYNLYRRSMDGRTEVDNARQTISSQNTIFEVKSVQSHIEYQFWVTASTRIGEGQSSKVVSQVATPRANHNIQLMDTGELILSKLQIGDVGNYTCHVDNGQGTDRIIYHLIVQIPPIAPLLYVTSATSSSVLLHWKAGNNGGASISGFTLNYKKEHGDIEEVHLSRHATSYELKGLSCGTTYHLYLIAHNKIGSSPASHPLQARTQGHPPGVPSLTSFISPNSTSVILRLHVWPDNGCPILYFILQYKKATDTQWTLVSNALKPQRRTSITGLTPATQYVVKLEAHNVAGFSTEEFNFMTLTKEGGHNDAAKEQLDNQQNAEAQRERYYATIHKVSLQAGEKIPETSEDISPYATFQLSEPSTLPQNTMLHSFMYHEHPMTEGCASPPPATSSVQRNSPYYNIASIKVLIY